MKLWFIGLPSPVTWKPYTQEVSRDLNHNTEGGGGYKESNGFFSQKAGGKDVAKIQVKNLAVYNVTFKPARSLDRNSKQLGTNTKNTQKRDDEAMMYEGTCKEVLEEGTYSAQSCRRLPKFGRPPEFGSFQKIAQNFCAILKLTLRPSSQSWNWVKTSNGVGEN